MDGLIKKIEVLLSQLKPILPDDQIQVLSVFLTNSITPSSSLITSLIPLLFSFLAHIRIKPFSRNIPCSLVDHFCYHFA